MAEAQNNRTGPIDDQQKVSWTVESLDRGLRLGFKNWVRRFQTAINNAPGAVQAWKVLSEECNEQDLEWAFYWAVVRVETDMYAPEVFREFHRKSHKLLRDMLRLRPTLKEVMACKVGGVPVWYQYFGFLGLSEKEAVRFWVFQAYFDLFVAKLFLSVGKGKGSESPGLVSRSPRGRLAMKVGSGKTPGGLPKPLAPPIELLNFNAKDCTIALPAELLQLYIKGETGRPHHEEVSVLLQLAADAYGLDEVGSGDAIEKRYKRFCRDHPGKVKEIMDDISEMWRKRIDDNERVDLIPFLVAREQARAKPIIDYIKALRSRHGMP
jgi:hypothetical protein